MSTRQTVKGHTVYTRQTVKGHRGTILLETMFLCVAPANLKLPLWNYYLLCLRVLAFKACATTLGQKYSLKIGEERGGLGRSRLASLLTGVESGQIHNKWRADF